uniref:HTH psq-type domain-containing protein n=1 Tax=Cyprinus carpio TaxID=7962 RepID=A0A8C2KBF8_CYPCA
MPRDRKRITYRGVPLPILSLAAAVVSNDGRTVRSVAKEYSIGHTTLYRFIKKRERLSSGEEMRTGYWTPRRVFSVQQEDSLAEYLKRIREITPFHLHFHLPSISHVRRLAFQLAVYYKCSYPETWNECSLAGRDWFMGFMKRQPSLSIRCPQATSLTRNTSFNRHNVSLFLFLVGEYYFECPTHNPRWQHVLFVRSRQSVFYGLFDKHMWIVDVPEIGRLHPLGLTGLSLSLSLLQPLAANRPGPEPASASCS